MSKLTNRRKFLEKTANASLFVGGYALFANPNVMNGQSDQTSINDINIVGPKEGYAPQIGTLVSMMNWMRSQILYPVRGLSTSDLDYIHDENSNSIGSMLLHLAATERFYQINTFEGKEWGDWSKKDDKEWSTPMGLGEEARQSIKGHSLDFYLEKLQTVRENTLSEFARRDDKWLMTVDDDCFWGPTNNYCKWFHVCEHESNHSGQIKYIKSRIA